MRSRQRNPDVARPVSVRSGRNACPTWSNGVAGRNDVPGQQSRLRLVPAWSHVRMPADLFPHVLLCLGHPRGEGRRKRFCRAAARKWGRHSCLPLDHSEAPSFFGDCWRHPASDLQMPRPVSVRAGRNACPTWSNVVAGRNDVPGQQSRLGLVPGMVTCADTCRPVSSCSPVSGPPSAGRDAASVSAESVGPDSSGRTDSRASMITVGEPGTRAQ
ncbi:hypothetical protein Mal4_53810 [Maioricimonas rarisocia]|uniref:Uncharacterized protein n=1 Tax=Maioricimonas rarisocia TaxID=2528026 RepID=A0A517ZEX7_9PLAN|nr:hypothetical protein Mal4_53810 [Maioricimonas rarisocia]